MEPIDPANIRTEYTSGELLEANVAADAIEQFGRWFADALAAQLPEPNAMTLATADASGRPSARIVLLKGFDERGFVFFTSLVSRKARELAVNPRASLVIFWQALERQVRIEGAVETVTRAETEAYFRTRPVKSQIGAWVSRQSEPLASRDDLEGRAVELSAKFAGGEIPAPDSWGGYRVMPERLEFWQGRRNRLHDRLLYTRSGASWVIQRLWP